MSRRLPWTAALVAGLFCTAHAATITIVNQDGAGEGFNDNTAAAPEGGNSGTTRGQQRLKVFQAAANIWGATLTSNIAIKVGAKFDVIAGCTQNDGGILGFAGPSTFTSMGASPPAGYFSNTWYAIAEAEAVRNTNLNTTSNELYATFNTDIDSGCLFPGTRFWYGIDSTPVPANRIALLPTVLHELGHGLGFLTLVDDSDGSLANGLPDIWTYFLKNAQTGELWKDMTNAERLNSMTDDPRLIWDGPAVNAAIPTFQPTGAGLNVATQRMRMYAPASVQPGSSVSHWTTEAANPNLLMEPVLSDSLFDETDMTVALFDDIGWPLANASATISIADRSLAESTSPMNFTLTRTNTTGTASVVVTTAAGTATGGGTDYTSVTSQSVTFAAGSATATLNVSINNDNIDELDETFVVNLTSPSAGYTISDAQATGTITDNDTSTVSINDPAAVPEGGSVGFTISLSNPSSRSVTVRADTANGTAVASGDFTARSNVSVSFTAGDVAETFTISSNNDNIDELDETFVVNLTTPTGGATINDGQGTGTLIDNDTSSISINNPPAVGEGGNAVFTITLSTPNSRTVTVRADTQDDSAAGPDDFVQRTNVGVNFSAGDVSETFSVSTNDDNLNEADNEQFAVALSNVSASAVIGDGSSIGTIIDNDATPTISIADAASEAENNINPMRFVVTLSGPNQAPISVTASTADGSATVADDDYQQRTSTITFASGDTSENFDVTKTGDSAPESDENFAVNLTNATNGMVVSDANAAGMISNDDFGPPVSIANATLGEGDVGLSDMAFTVSIPAVSDFDVNVNYSIVPIDASAILDYSVLSGTATIPVTETSTTINVPIVGDLVDEWNEQFAVNLTATATSTIGDGQATGTIIDDDTGVLLQRDGFE